MAFRISKTTVKSLVHIAILCYSVLCLVPVQNTGPEGIPHFDKIVHFGAYLLFALGYFFVYPQKIKFCTAVLFLHGILIEIAQSQTAFRHFELLDIASDTVGISIALLIYKFTIEKPS